MIKRLMQGDWSNAWLGNWFHNEHEWTKGPTSGPGRHNAFRVGSIHLESAGSDARSATT